MNKQLLWSNRFNKSIQITHHAQARMVERCINNMLLLDLVETGILKYKDSIHLWIFKHYPERHDNLICAAILFQEAIVVKTVMINWQYEE